MSNNNEEENEILDQYGELVCFFQCEQENCKEIYQAITDKENGQHLGYKKMPVPRADGKEYCIYKLIKHESHGFPIQSEHGYDYLKNVEPDYDKMILYKALAFYSYRIDTLISTCPDCGNPFDEVFSYMMGSDPYYHGRCKKCNKETSQVAKGIYHDDQLNYDLTDEEVQRLCHINWGIKATPFDVTELEKQLQESEDLQKLAEIGAKEHQKAINEMVMNNLPLPNWMFKDAEEEDKRRREIIRKASVPWNKSGWNTIDSKQSLTDVFINEQNKTIFLQKLKEKYPNFEYTYASDIEASPCPDCGTYNQVCSITGTIYCLKCL